MFQTNLFNTTMKVEFKENPVPKVKIIEIVVSKCLAVNLFFTCSKNTSFNIFFVFDYKK